MCEKAEEFYKIKGQTCQARNDPKAELRTEKGFFTALTFLNRVRKKYKQTKNVF